MALNSMDVATVSWLSKHHGGGNGAMAIEHHRDGGGDFVMAS